MNEVLFSGDVPGLDSYESKPWNVGDSYLVEFFPRRLVPVKLTSVDSAEFEASLDGIVDDKPIALDLEWDSELCLFQFCTSKGALVVRHERHDGDIRLRDFLSSHQFFGKGTANDRRQLRMKFGCDFADIEDIAETRLVPYGHSENFMQMTVQFAGAPAALFKDSAVAKSSWSAPVLSMRQVLYAAFDVVAIYECYPKLPPPRVKAKRERPKDAAAPKRHKKERKHSDTCQTVKKVVMKQNSLRETHSYVLRDYDGPVGRDYLRGLFRCSGDVDVIASAYRHVFLSVSAPVQLDGFVELPRVRPDIVDGEFLYVTNIPRCLANAQSFQQLLCLFGTDQRVTFKPGYCRIECCSAQASYRLRTFLPALEVDGGRMVLWEFPFFMNRVCVSNLPATFSDGDINDLFKSIQIEPVAVELENRRDAQDEVSAIVSLPSQEACERAIAELSYRVCNGLEMRVFAFIEEPQARSMRQYLIYVEHPESSAALMKQFGRYGRVHHAFVDTDLGIGCVQFYSRCDALQVPPTEGHFAETGATIVLRDVPVSVTRKHLIELCMKYGRVMGVVTRMLIPKFGYQIFEITFATASAALQAKLGLNGSQIDQLQVVANVYLGAGQEVPVWKMEQHYLWVAVSPASDEASLREAFPSALDIRITDSSAYLMFPTREEARASGYRSVTLSEFVECTGSTCLVMQDTPQQNPVPFDSQQWAIVIDPIPPSFSAEIMREWCPGCFYDFVVLPSQTPGRRRAVVYIEGHKMTKKIYALIRNKLLDGESIHPAPMKRDQIPDFDAPMAVIIEPLPDSIDEPRIRGNIIMGRSAKIDVLDAAGKKAMVIWPENRCDGKIIAKLLKAWSVEFSFHVKKVYK